MRTPTRDLPARAASGAFILHAGWEKWRAGPDVAEGVHGAAASAFPALAGVPPQRFLRALAAAEMGLGAALLLPVVPSKVAGAGLAAFAGSLLAMYLRTPAFHRPGSIRPTPAGLAVSKDVWLLGIGAGLVAGDRGGDR